MMRESSNGGNHYNNNLHLNSILDFQSNDEPKKLVKVNLWITETNPNLNRIIELDSMRSFQINPAFLGYDTERLRSDPLKRRMEINISATTDPHLFKSFQIPEPQISLSARGGAGVLRSQERKSIIKQ